MRPSRADVFPMLVIMAGGAIGALLTLSPILLFGPIDDVLAPVPVLSPPEEAPAVVRPVRGRAVPVWSSNGTSIVYQDANGNVYRTDSGERVTEAVQISPDGRWIVYRSSLSAEGTRLQIRRMSDFQSPEYRSNTSAEGTAEPRR